MRYLLGWLETRLAQITLNKLKLVYLSRWFKPLYLSPSRRPTSGCRRTLTGSTWWPRPCSTGTQPRGVRHCPRPGVPLTGVLETVVFAWPDKCFRDAKTLAQSSLNTSFRMSARQISTIPKTPVCKTPVKGIPGGASRCGAASAAAGPEDAVAEDQGYWKW